LRTLSEEFSKPGKKVRLISDPSRMAITTGKVKSAGPFTMVQIEFGPNEKPFKRINQLELVSDTPEDCLTSALMGPNRGIC
jgi:hypothetical protein